MSVTLVVDGFVPHIWHNLDWIVAKGMGFDIAVRANIFTRGMSRKSKGNREAFGFRVAELSIL